MIMSPLEWVRQNITSAFSEMGSASAVPPRETMLIRNGLYCGRRFERDGLRAVWFVEEDEIKFFDEVGRLIRVSSGVAAPARRAG